MLLSGAAEPQPALSALAQLHRANTKLHGLAACAAATEASLAAGGVLLRLQVLQSRELSVVSQAIGQGKPLVVVANKMDALPDRKDRQLYLSTLVERLVSGRGSGDPCCANRRVTAQ